MKKLLYFAIVLCALTGMNSCSKDLEHNLPGKYHFKMSGLFWASSNPATGKVEYREFLLKNQTGTMTIVHDNGDNYICNMSVAFGDVLAFKARSVGNDTIALLPHQVVTAIYDPSENSGASFLNSSISVPLIFSGKGRLIDKTVNYIMTASGCFQIYDSESKSYIEYTILENDNEYPQDIVCFADRI